MAKVNVAGVIFAVISVMIMLIILVIFIKMGLHRATNRTTYNLKHKIEAPSQKLLAYLHVIDAYMWIVQLYVITIAFICHAELSTLCDTAYPTLGEACRVLDTSERFKYKVDINCTYARAERVELCGEHSECDITLSSVYNLDDSYSCDGPSCLCSSSQAVYAIPMLMIVSFGVSFLFDIAKIVAIYKYFWDYLEMKDSHIFCIAFVSDSPCLDCCTCCCAHNSYEAIIHFYWYKRRYFRYNCITITYVTFRYIIFFISAFIMFGLINALKTYKTETVIGWYDILPLFALWIINEFVIKLRYKCIAPYTKREHVLYVLSMVTNIDEYNIVRIISEYMGPDELLDYKIAIEQDELLDYKIAIQRINDRVCVS